MKAIVFDSPGGPEVLKLQEVADPEVRTGEALVRVAATALNRADVMQRQGNYPPPPGASDILGLECSGTIEAFGPGTDCGPWKIGDQVCALLAGGGYAEKVAVPCGQLLPVPKGISLRGAAAIPEVACTVWSTVFLTSRLTPAETFLVHGGSSGIGSFAIQFANNWGCRVFCTAGSSAKLDFCKKLGADVAINYREEDFVERVMAETSGRGVDVILDNMGASYLQRNLSALAKDGRLFIIGLQGGPQGEIDLRPMLAKRLTVSSGGLRARDLEDKARIVKSVRENVWPVLESGKVNLTIHARYPLAEASEAHRILEESSHSGKIVLDVQA